MQQWLECGYKQQDGVDIGWLEKVSKGTKLTKIKVTGAGVLHTAAMWVRHWLFTQNTVTVSCVCISGKKNFSAYMHLSSCSCF